MKDDKILEELLTLIECERCGRIGGGFFMKGEFFIPDEEMKKVLYNDYKILKGYCIDYPNCEKEK